MECGQCGKQNPPDARFCIQCGAAMAAGAGGHDGPPEDRAAYGGFWVRVGAYLVDGVIIGVPQIVAQAVISPETMAVRGPDEPVPPAEVAWFLVNMLVAWLYWAGMHSSRYQATLGKMVFGLRVVDFNGERISFLRATGRHFATILSGMILMIGYIMVAFTRRRQALHDLIAQTLVVRKEWVR
ncbi:MULTISPECIES: RDD family protein [unclassified Thioalkalivibrio]|uniref:RDD family protein n=1 Tax=unclassified Thioalkalivibrio TaxID=2621013 RepID=UPI00036473F9|nr:MULTISPECIES: RDD family protein [unclassified Thioalkalivibrio]